MKRTPFSSKRMMTAFACVSLVSLMAACGPDNGYYDSDGRYVQSTASHGDYPNLGGRNPDYDYYARGDKDDRYAEYPYERRGYYDRSDRYITLDNGLRIPEQMFPSRGMCRVWFADRSLADQPDIQECRRIKKRVPRGGYLIYGR